MQLLAFSSINSAQRNALLSPIQKAEPELAAEFPKVEKYLDALVISANRGKATQANTGIMSREAFPGIYAERDRICHEKDIKPLPVLVADLNNSSVSPNAYTTRINVGSFFRPKHVSVVVFNRAMLEVMGGLPAVSEDGRIENVEYKAPPEIEFTLAHELGHQTGWRMTKFLSFASATITALATAFGLGALRGWLEEKHPPKTENKSLVDVVSSVAIGTIAMTAGTLAADAYSRYEESHSDKEGLQESTPGSGHSTIEILKKIHEKLWGPEKKKGWFAKLWDRMNSSHPAHETRLEMTGSDHEAVKKFKEENATRLEQIDNRIERLALIKDINKELSKTGDPTGVMLSSKAIEEILQNERNISREAQSSLVKLHALVKSEEAGRAAIMPLAV